MRRRPFSALEQVFHTSAIDWIAVRLDVACMQRLRERAESWGVVLDETIHGEDSLIAFGRRAGDQVAIKVWTRPADPSNANAVEVLRAFAGPAVVRVIDGTDDAMLMERIAPGHSLAEVALRGEDEEATRILADMIAKLTPRYTPASCSTVQEWGVSFDRYVKEEGDGLASESVQFAHGVYEQLARTQRSARLLHGDLHHYNVLYDSKHGWVVIDPKGVVGELEFEIGAALRNPIGRPELFLDPDVIERRLEIFSSRLAIDPDRTLAWAFSQAVLSALWSIEDGLSADAGPAVRLAEVLRVMF